MATEYQEKSQLSSETNVYSMISPKLPHSIMERVGFSYEPPKDPLQAAHEREMARSREKFRQ